MTNDKVEIDVQTLCWALGVLSMANDIASEAPWSPERDEFTDNADDLMEEIEEALGDSAPDEDLEPAAMPPITRGEHRRVVPIMHRTETGMKPVHN